ncbi:unnamed protein product [Symbiodinium microadriaticum]|nr:unnamed protein product [Symbiodinium microadriaticum]
MWHLAVLMAKRWQLSTCSWARDVGQRNRVRIDGWNGQVHIALDQVHIALDQVHIGLGQVLRGELPRSQWVDHVLHRLDAHFGSTGTGFAAEKGIRQVVALGAEVPKRPPKAVAFKPMVPTRTTWPPQLARDGWTRFENHELPGDELVSLRFRSQRNWKPFLFLPCILMSFATDSPVLCSETTPEILDGNETRVSCAFGDPAKDIFTQETVCPVVCGFSPVHYVPMWYGAFCLTIVFCWWRGRSVDHDSYYARRGGVRGRPASAVALFLDCSRAGYSDRHLIVLLVVFSLCAVHSLLVRWASLLEEGGINNGCIGYGDWSGLDDVCHQGPFLEQGWPVFLVIYFMVFFGALMDQGIVGAKELRKVRGRKLAARKRQEVWERFSRHLCTVDSVEKAMPAEQVRGALYRFVQQTVPMSQPSVRELINSELSWEHGVYIWPQSSTGFVSLATALPTEMESGERKELGPSGCRKEPSDKQLWEEFSKQLERTEASGEASSQDQVRNAFSQFAHYVMPRWAAFALVDGQFVRDGGTYRFSDEIGGFVRLSAVMRSEQNVLDEWMDYDQIEMDRLTAAAVKLKALVRHQMHVTRESSKRNNSGLANAMLFACDAFRFLLGYDDADSEEELSLNMIDDFDERLQEIEAEGPCRPIYPDKPVPAERNTPSEMELQSSEGLGHVLEAEAVNMFRLYWFCPVIQSFKGRTPARTMDAKEGGCCGWVRAHMMLGAMFGLTGVFLLSFMVPQGDSFTFAYFWVSKKDMWETRCEVTSSMNASSPWCSAERVITMTRMTLSPALHGVPSTSLVWVCLVVKAVIFCILGGLFGITMFKTVEGLRQAQHPMQILQVILLRWSQSQKISTWQLQAWKMARASILHNDVRLILDRFENVVIFTLVVCMLFITDAVIQYVVFSKPPNIGAVYIVLVFALCTMLCINAALGCHLAQQAHLKTLSEMKEETSFIQSVSPDGEYFRKFVDLMIKRLSSGGDYQTKLLYMPLNPVLQKSILAYFAASLAAIAGKLFFGG